MNRVRGLLRELLATARRSARLACGVPDYDAYVAHVHAHHPDRTPLPYAEFFRQRQDARYGRGGRSPCC